MRVIIEKASSGTKGIWTAEIDPQRLIKLAKPVRQGGRLSVVMINRPIYEESASTLQFDLDSAFLLNLGNTFETVFIDSREKDFIDPSLKPQTKQVDQPSGDRRYLDELTRLPDSQKELGEQILIEIRKEFPGELVFHPKSGKFVESPDNFWVVRIQPRAQSLRIIVYGRPEGHKRYESIHLKNDMAGYSNFVVDRQQQLFETVSIIREAKRLKDLM